MTPYDGVPNGGLPVPEFEGPDARRQAYQFSLFMCRLTGHGAALAVHPTPKQGTPAEAQGNEHA